MGEQRVSHKNKKFFYRRFVSVLSHISNIVIVVFFALFLFAFLSRANILNLFGGFIVYSGSMEPSIHRWDLVISIRGSFSKGDVIVYCVNPSFCVVHRVVDFCSNNNCVITKGDANPAADPPVSLRQVKGVVVFVVPRYLWLPLFLSSVSFAVASFVKTRIIGISSALTYATILLFIMLVYGFAQPVPGYTRFNLPALYLSRAEFDSKSCTVIIKYTGDLAVSNASMYVNGILVQTTYNSTHVVGYLPLQVAGEAFEGGSDLNVSVLASLNTVGRLYGSYKIKVYGDFLEVSISNGSLAIYNPNCFPVRVNISFQYAYGVGESWRYTNTSVVVNGFETVYVEPPEGSRFAYAYVEYLVWGEKKWQVLVVRYG